MRRTDARGRERGRGGAESGSGSSHKNATNRFSQLAKSELILLPTSFF